MNYSAEKEYCNTTLQSWSTFIIIIHFVTLSLFFPLLYVFISLRSSFHPFFSFFIINITISYILIQSSTTFLNVFRFSGRPDISHLCAISFDFMYYFILPINISLALERLLSTIYFGSYEKNRQWLWVVIAVICWFGFAFSMLFTNFGNIGSTGEAIIMAVGSLISLMGLFILIIVNIRLTKSFTRKGKELTVRYQLAENIKALRIMIPFLLSDNLITVNNSLWYYLLKIDTVFDIQECVNRKREYLMLYLAAIVMRRLLISVIPLVIFSSNKNMRNYLCFLLRKLHRIEPKPSKNPNNSLKNIFGQRIDVVETQEEYFENLRKTW